MKQIKLRSLFLIGGVITLFLFAGIFTTSAGVNAPTDKQIEKSDEMGKGSVNVGDPAPNFNVPLLNNEWFTLWDYSGYIVLINIWKTG